MVLRHAVQLMHLVTCCGLKTKLPGGIRSGGPLPRILSQSFDPLLVGCRSFLGTHFEFCLRLFKCSLGGLLLLVQGGGEGISCLSARPSQLIVEVATPLSPLCLQLDVLLCRFCPSPPLSLQLSP